MPRVVTRCETSPRTAQPPRRLRRLKGVTTINWMQGATLLSRSNIRAVSVEAEVHRVYTAEYSQLAGWAARLVSDPDLAHDFVTEAFVRLLKHWPKVTGPRAWLYTCVANQVKDHWRKRERESRAYRKFASSAPPDAQVSEHATTLSVRDAVQSLPDRLRLPVLLHYFADLTVAQVASSLELSDGAVKRYLFEARALLAPRLEDVR